MLLLEPRYFISSHDARFLCLHSSILAAPAQRRTVSSRKCKVLNKVGVSDAKTMAYLDMKHALASANIEGPGTFFGMTV